MSKLQPYLRFRGRDWTHEAALPGGDLPGTDFDRFVLDALRRWPRLPEDLVERLARGYGARMERVLGVAHHLDDLGEHFGAGLTQAEVDYLRRYEWAVTADDILWRRTKLGLHMNAAEKRSLEQALVG